MIIMQYEKALIHMTATAESSDCMYSLVCLKASSLSLTLGQIRCFLDGYYLLCLTHKETLTVPDGQYEALTLHFLPYFYNVNLNHNVIGMPMYEEMRALYGYPDFGLFRTRNDRYFGILRLNEEEYTLIRVHFQCVARHIEQHLQDPMWSCRTRSDMITILRIAESVYRGEQTEESNEILRYIRSNLGKELSLTSLCQHFHTNRTTLTNIVKKLTGMSPMQYVLIQRLNQSRPDLLFTYIPIGEIAVKYGFPGSNYYIRAFKRQFGLTPLQYRNKGRAERIRNEKIYHEREKEYLNKKEKSQ